MSSLSIWRAKPNPKGKDKDNEKPISSQLNGEWIELKNNTASVISLGDMKVYHTKFDQNGNPEPTLQLYWTGKESLKLVANGVVRVHTGHAADEGAMALEDKSGADLHAFAEHGTFKLNNREGDYLYLYSGQNLIDKAYYEKNVRDGAVLTRVGDKLVDHDQGGTTGTGSTGGKQWNAPAIVGHTGKAA